MLNLPPTPQVMLASGSLCHPTTPDYPITPFPPGPNPPILVRGAPEEESFQSVLVTDLCLNKILLKVELKTLVDPIFSTLLELLEVSTNCH